VKVRCREAQRKMSGYSYGKIDSKSKRTFGRGVVRKVLLEEVTRNWEWVEAGRLRGWDAGPFIWAQGKEGLKGGKRGENGYKEARNWGKGGREEGVRGEASRSITMKNKQE